MFVTIYKNIYVWPHVYYITNNTNLRRIQNKDGHSNYSTRSKVVKYHGNKIEQYINIKYKYTLDKH